MLDTEPDVADRPGAREAGRIRGAIDLDTVSFAYGDEPTLTEVDVHVPAGGCLALVGESGGGKSTLAKLVARFYDPDAGTVRVDGVDLRDYRLESYRRNLGVVLQDPFLFAGTIASNIRFGRPEATDEEVRAAAAAVGVDRVAARFPDGLDHAVREGGAGLSAGERQLISIARALLADPRILVLDEATSSIDRPTEVLVERALDRLLRGRTSLVVAHRLATVQRADEILVVEHGRVVQRGSGPRRCWPWTGRSAASRRRTSRADHAPRDGVVWRPCRAPRPRSTPASTSRSATSSPPRSSTSRSPSTTRPRRCRSSPRTSTGRRSRSATTR